MQVTQKNLYTLIPPKVAKITTLLRANNNMTVQQALLTFYRSKAYQLLEREETKLWYASPAQIFAEYMTTPEYSKGRDQNDSGKFDNADFE